LPKLRIPLAVHSFRDPAGCCLAINNRIYRAVNTDGLALLESFLQSSTARQFLPHSLVGTRKLDPAEFHRWLEQPVATEIQAALGPPAAVFEHDRVPFPSFPYEWTPEMLLAAGQLTLELALAALDEDFGLKDATPYNVLFRGPAPVFVDLLSFERRVPGDAIWKPYAQFVRTFLLPLAAWKFWGLSLAEVFTTHRDGLEPEQVFRWCGLWQKLRPPLLSLVSLPAWLSGRKTHAALYHPPPLSNPEKARFIVRMLLKRQRRVLEQLQPAGKPASVWVNYMEANSYSGAAFAAKQEFVRKMLADCRPKRVLDIGANTGHFSLLAAQAGARVVSLDTDPVCLGQLWRQAQAKTLDILPLVVDFARPSPGLGWRNRECPSFLERATGNFDAVFMLAVLHHLLVSERVPLAEVLELAAALTTEWLVIEFVPPQDEMFGRIVRGREELFKDLNADMFEATCRRWFEVARRAPIQDTQRILYLLRKLPLGISTTTEVA
jgi:SAM-dependent methyltransferase